jgi:hypothetical protein
VRQIQQTNKKIEKIEIFPSAMKNKMNWNTNGGDLTRASGL